MMLSIYISKANFLSVCLSVCQSVCMFARHAQTAAPIQTKLGTSVPSVPGVVIGRSNFGSGCPKTRENQKKTKKKRAHKRDSGSAQNQRSRTLKSKGRDATSSSYLQIQNDVDNVFLNENSECQTYF